MVEDLKNKSMLEICRNDFFEKIFKSEIFTTNKIEGKILLNTKRLAQMENKDKKLVLESLEEISVYNKDFASLKEKYLLLSSDGIISLANLKYFIKYLCPGFYKKAKFYYAIRLILMMAQLLILYLLVYPKNICTDIPFEQKDKDSWTFNGEKYKVITVIRDRDWYLRTLIFFIDFIFYICEAVVLKNLQRIKADKFLIISFQISKFIVFAIITFNNIYYISEKNYCKNNVLEIISIIYDVIKNYIDL